MASSKKKLSKNELLFCHEYVACKFNATEAYLKAYGVKNKKHAASSGSRLLRRINIKNKIKQLTKKRIKTVEPTADNVIKELAILAFQKGDDFAEFDGENVDFKSFEDMGEKTACIKEIETTTRFVPTTDEDGKKTLEREQKIKMKMHDKKGSLELLGKTHRLFVDKVEVTDDINKEHDSEANSAYSNRLKAIEKRIKKIDGKEKD